MGNASVVLQDLNDNKDENTVDHNDNHKITDKFEVGDYLKCVNEDGTSFEGLYIERAQYNKVILLVEDETKECLVENCSVVVKADDLEIGDRVQIKLPESYIYYLGRISQIHENNGIKTYDIDMEGDDEDDKEYGVLISNIKKIMSRRALVVSRWKKGKNVVNALSNLHAVLST